MTDKADSILQGLNKEQLIELLKEVMKPEATPISEPKQNPDIGRSKQQRPVPKGNGKGSSGYTGNIELGRTLTPVEGHENLHKEDTETDRLLWGRNRPTARIPKTDNVEVVCQGPCGRTMVVNSKLVFSIDGEVSYTCNDCIISRRG